MAALWESQGANKCNDSRCVTKSGVVRCSSGRYCCTLHRCDTQRKLFKVSWLMQILALEVLIQILLTSLTLRLSQGFVTELKVWFLNARVVSFTCLSALSLLLYFIFCEGIFTQRHIFYARPWSIFGSKITIFASMSVCTFMAYTNLVTALHTRVLISP